MQGSVLAVRSICTCRPRPPQTGEGLRTEELGEAPSGPRRDAQGQGRALPQARHGAAPHAYRFPPAWDALMRLQQSPWDQWLLVRRHPSKPDKRKRDAAPMLRELKAKG